MSGSTAAPFATDFTQKKSESQMPAGKGTPIAITTGEVVYSGKDRRQKRQNEADLEPVVLMKKFADALNGIVLGGFKVGDRLVLVRQQAALLIAEGWACPVPREQRRRPA